MKKKFISLLSLSLSMLTTAIAFSSYGADGTITLTGAVILTGCTINSGAPNMTVPLGTVDANSLVGGAYSSDADFQIQLTNCPTGLSKASVVLDGTAHPTDMNSFANTASSTPATNVGIRLFNNTGQIETMIPPQGSSSQITITGQSATLPLTARMVGLASGTNLPGAGNVSATINYTILYQ